MRDHDVVANLDGVHAGTSFQDSFDGRDRTKGRRGAIGPSESRKAAASVPRRLAVAKFTRHFTLIQLFRWT
jgi:hypothetical protein